MWNFSKKSNEKINSDKNNINSSEYEKLSIRISDLTAEVKGHKAALDALQTSLDNLRGNFNRKLSSIKDEPKEEKKKEETENINNDHYIPFG